MTYEIQRGVHANILRKTTASLAHNTSVMLPLLVLVQDTIMIL